jgi:TIR domain
LFNDLVARLGESAVFMDVDSISLGRDFRSELQKTLAACDLMLVIIDKDWAAVKDERGRSRLEDAGDFVRMEIEAALKRGMPVTPVLVKGAQMPAAEELPAEIRDLAYRNGFELSHSRWESDVREMIRLLQTPHKAVPTLPGQVGGGINLKAVWSRLGRWWRGRAS